MTLMGNFSIKNTQVVFVTYVTWRVSIDHGINIKLDLTKVEYQHSGNKYTSVFLFLG